MSFSSTSSKESSSVMIGSKSESNGIVLNSSLSEPGKNKFHYFQIRNFFLQSYFSI